MGEIAITVENLSKRYTLGLSRRRHNTLGEQLSQGARSFFRRNPDKAGLDSFWALKDVSMEVKRGEVVGIVGRNGAGKSTLLKILSRITEPTEGEATIRGRVGSLLEVGTGFQPELTGRENIFLNGAILGMKKAEIERRFDEIVAFSEVEKFLDTPVKRYSSGMYVRLAFSVAAHMEPDVLIIDEVLAVGDSAFQKKCLGTMDLVGKQGRTVLFVSHNMAAVRNLCSRAILFSAGRVLAEGPSADIVENYLTAIDSSQVGSVPLGERKDRVGEGAVRVVGFEARVPGGTGGGSLRTGAPAEFVIEYAVKQEHPLRRMYAGIVVTDSSGADVFTCSTAMSNADFYGITGKGKLICQTDYLPLKPDRYWVNIKLSEYHGHYTIADEVIRAAGFEVYEGGDSGFVDFGKGAVVVPHNWRLSPGSDLDLQNCVSTKD